MTAGGAGTGGPGKNPILGAKGEQNKSSQDPGWKKNLEKGYYSIFTGERFNTKGKRDTHDHKHKVEYAKANPDKFPGLPSNTKDQTKFFKAINWQAHGADYSSEYGAKGKGKGIEGTAFNVKTRRVNYKSDWVGPDWKGADKNANFRKVWSALTSPGLKLDQGQRGGIGEDEYSHMKSFLVAIKQGGTRLENMSKGNVDKIIGIISDFKAKAKKMKTPWNRNTYKKENWQPIANELGKTQDYAWLKESVPHVEIKGEKKFFDYKDYYAKGLADLGEDTAKNYETKFIDEFFGTTEGEVGTEGLGKLQQGDPLTKEYRRRGVDLVRVDVGFEIGSERHYRHITRGKVNWAHYRTDKMFNKAAAALDIDPKSITGKGDLAQTGRKTYENIDTIREVNEKIDADRNIKDKEGTWMEWDNLDWTYGIGPNHLETDDKGVTWSTDLKTGNKTRQITFSELTEPDSKYYVPPGKTKTFVVGMSADGEKLTKTVDSPWTDMSKWVYDPDKVDQDKDHYTPSRGTEYIHKRDEHGEKIKKDGKFVKIKNPNYRRGFKVEAKVEKKRDIIDGKPPTIKGVTWDDSGTPSLAKPAKLNKAPTIKPISTKSYAQT